MCVSYYQELQEFFQPRCGKVKIFQQWSIDRTYSHGSEGLPINKKTKFSRGRSNWETHSYVHNNSSVDPIDRWPNWKANSDGSMIFPPNEYGGHGNHLLELKYTYRMILIAKFEKMKENG